MLRCELSHFSAHNAIRIHYLVMSLTFMVIGGAIPTPIFHITGACRKPAKKPLIARSSRPGRSGVVNLQYTSGLLSAHWDIIAPPNYFSSLYSIVESGVNMTGLSCASLLNDGNTVSKNGVIEFVEPLVCTNPRFRTTFFNLNVDAVELNLKISVFVKGKIKLVVNDENGFLLALKSV